jgi:hypothetical protein
LLPVEGVTAALRAGRDEEVGGLVLVLRRGRREIVALVHPEVGPARALHLEGVGPRLLEAVPVDLTGMIEGVEERGHHPRRERVALGRGRVAVGGGEVHVGIHAEVVRQIGRAAEPDAGGSEAGLEAVRPAQVQRQRHVLDAHARVGVPEHVVEARAVDGAPLRHARDSAVEVAGRIRRGVLEGPPVLEVGKWESGQRHIGEVRLGAPAGVPFEQILQVHLVPGEHPIGEVAVDVQVAQDEDRFRVREVRDPHRAVDHERDVLELLPPSQEFLLGVGDRLQFGGVGAGGIARLQVSDDHVRDVAGLGILEPHHGGPLLGPAVVLLAVVELDRRDAAAVARLADDTVQGKALGPTS